MGTYLVGSITFGIIGLIIWRSIYNWRKAEKNDSPCGNSCQDCPFAKTCHKKSDK